MKLEASFKKKTHAIIHERLPSCLTLHIDPATDTGIPDTMVICPFKWAALEFKASERSSRRPNQDYYINKLNDMGFAKFIYPENSEEVIDEMVRYITE